MKASAAQLQQAGMDAGKLETMNRKARRGVIVTGLVRRTGKQTGTTSHFAEWKRAGAIKSALQRMSLARIADQAADEDAIQAAHGFAILYVSKKYKTVWDLVQVQSRGYLFVIDGIGDKRIDAMAAYLKAKQVNVPWATR